MSNAIKELQKLSDRDRDILEDIGDEFGSRLENLPSDRRRDFLWFLHLAIGYLIREVEKMEREFGGLDPDSDDEYNLEWAIVQLGIDWKRDVTDRNPAIEKLLGMLNELSLPALSEILSFLVEEQNGYCPQEKKPSRR